MSLIPATTPKMCSTKASTCRRWQCQPLPGSCKIGLGKQDCQQAAATRNGCKSEHHPWAACRDLAGMASVAVWPFHAWYNCHVQSSEILGLALCLFDPLIQFCSPSELMQTICTFANFSVTADTIPSKLSQSFVPVIAARSTSSSSSSAEVEKIRLEAAMGIRKALKD